MRTAKRLCIAAIGLALALATTALAGEPLPGEINRVNDFNFDIGKGDGTNDTQYDPATTLWGPQGRVGAVLYVRPSGGSQRVGSSFTEDGGDNWTDNGNIAGGSNSLRGIGNVVWNEKTLRYAGIFWNTFGGSGQMPAAFAESSNKGVSWGPIVDTYTNIGPGIEAQYPWLEVDNYPTSPNFGQYSIAWTQDSPSDPDRPLYFQGPSSGTGWPNPRMINEADCPVVGSGKLTISMSYIYAAYTCKEANTYTPMISRSADNGLTWEVASEGLPTDLAYSGLADDDCDSPVTRSYAGSVGAFDDVEIAYDPPTNTVFSTFTSRGSGGDLSNVHIFGMMETGGPAEWRRYNGLPGDDGSTYTFPAVGINQVGGALHLWYSVMEFDKSNAAGIKTFVTTDFSKWTPLSFHPTFPLPRFAPNEDSALGDCDWGTEHIRLNPMGESVGLTYTGVLDTGPPRSMTPAGADTDIDPDILFARLQAPVITQLSLAVKKTDAKINASGEIAPAVPGTAKVTLLKKKDGRFRKVASKQAPFDGEGAYQASFSRPSKGSCKVVAAFAGDDTYAPDQATKTFPCKV